MGKSNEEEPEYFSLTNNLHKETLMKSMTKISMVALLISFTASPALAADFSTMSTEDMAARRGTMQQATQEERAAFRQEWQSRVVRQMSAEELQQYNGPPSGAAQDGSGQQFRKGNGSQYRNSAQGGGSGYSRGGGGMGGGRGGRR